jgi:hypothetical protein
VKCFEAADSFIAWSAVATHGLGVMSLKEIDCLTLNILAVEDGV